MVNLVLTLLVVLVFILTIGIVWAVRRSRPDHQGGLVAENAALKERSAGLERDKMRLTEENESFRERLDSCKNDLAVRDRGIANLERQLALAMQELSSDRDQYEEKIKLLKEAREELTNHFKVLANNILDEKTRAFQEQNKTGIGEILNPLKERLGEFQSKIQENYENEGKERHSLRDEVRKLMEMNNRLSQEASNLTNALKRDSKAQGNWGEMILERILEVSGLRKGEEYTLQESHTLDDGSRVQPDVVIHLPEDRHMIIDSKVSLNAYDDYINKDDNVEQAEALKAHLSSVRTHMKELAAKDYHKLYEEKSPDFVIMFIPLEPAFMLALSEDGRIWEDAWKNNVLLVSSSTLLFVMRIVMQLWRQEQRSRNALEIARRGTALFDKLVGFVEDFENVGSRITQAGKSFESAKGKLSSGRGNLIRQAQMLKDLGITTNRQIPEEYIEQSLIEDNPGK